MTVEFIPWSISTKVWYRAGIELATPGSAVRHASVARHVTDCATRPGAKHSWLDTSMQSCHSFHCSNTWLSPRMSYTIILYMGSTNIKYQSINMAFTNHHLVPTNQLGYYKSTFGITISQTSLILQITIWYQPINWGITNPHLVSLSAKQHWRYKSPSGNNQTFMAIHKSPSRIHQLQ